MWQGLSLFLSGVVPAVNWGLIVLGWNGFVYTVGCGGVGFSLWLAGPSKMACWTEVRVYVFWAEIRVSYGVVGAQAVWEQAAAAAAEFCLLGMPQLQRVMNDA